MIIPLNATILEKFSFNINRNLSFAPHYKLWWQPADVWKKPVARCRSLEKTGLYILTCLS
jgi:hypothetical protein